MVYDQNIDQLCIKERGNANNRKAKQWNLQRLKNYCDIPLREVQQVEDLVLILRVF